MVSISLGWSGLASPLLLCFLAARVCAWRDSVVTVRHRWVIWFTVELRVRIGVVELITVFTLQAIGVGIVSIKEWLIVEMREASGWSWHLPIPHVCAESHAGRFLDHIVLLSLPCSLFCPPLLLLAVHPCCPGRCCGCRANSIAVRQGIRVSLPRHTFRVCHET